MKHKLDLVEVPIKDLIFSEYNPRALTPKEKSEIKKSIEKFGMVENVVANKNPARKNIVISGHQRIAILKELGYETVQVFYVDIADIKQEQELNVRVNKNSGHFNFDLLANFDEDILKNVGFESPELDKIFQLDSNEKDDGVPEENPKTSVKTGDIYKLGKHRLMCGDSTDAVAVAVLMQNDRADMIFSDPPYGVNYGHNQKEFQKKSGKYSKIRKYSKIENDNLKNKEISEKIWKPVFKNYFDFAKDDCSFYITNTLENKR